MLAQAPGQALLRAGSRLGKALLPCHCGLQKQPLGRRKSSWRAAQASHADETKQKAGGVGVGYWRGDGQLFLWGKRVEVLTSEFDLGRGGGVRKGGKKNNGDIRKAQGGTVASLEGSRGER